MATGSQTPFSLIDLDSGLAIQKIKFELTGRIQLTLFYLFSPSLVWSRPGAGAETGVVGTGTGVGAGAGVGAGERAGERTGARAEAGAGAAAAAGSGRMIFYLWRQD